MHAPIKYAEKGLSIAANGIWHLFAQLNKINPGPSMTPELVRQAGAEVAREDQTASGLAAPDRLALPDLRA